MTPRETLFLLIIHRGLKRGCRNEDSKEDENQD